MYYYLLYNSSFSFIVENRLFSTILYGSILYILTHAVLNYCNVSILTIINNYFWTTLTLDIISVSYAIYNTFINGNVNNENNNNNENNTDTLSNDSGNSSNMNNMNNMNVSFNLLKNKINTMFDRKNDLTITHIPNTSKNTNTNTHNTNTQNTNTHNTNTNNTNQVTNNQQNKQHNTISNSNQSKVKIQENFKNIETNLGNNLDLDFSNLDDIVQQSTSQTLQRSQESSQFSTPIKNLQLNKNKSQTSTPISLIRNNSKIEEPHIQDEHYNYAIGGRGENGESVAGSVAGSDVGSIMDLEDFEKSF